MDLSHLRNDIDVKLVPSGKHTKNIKKLVKMAIYRWFTY